MNDHKSYCHVNVYRRGIISNQTFIWLQECRDNGYQSGIICCMFITIMNL